MFWQEDVTEAKYVGGMKGVVDHRRVLHPLIPTRYGRWGKWCHGGDICSAPPARWFYRLSGSQTRMAESFFPAPPMAVSNGGTWETSESQPTRCSSKSRMMVDPWFMALCASTLTSTYLPSFWSVLKTVKYWHVHRGRERVKEGLRGFSTHTGLYILTKKSNTLSEDNNSEGNCMLYKGIHSTQKTSWQ